MPIRQTASIALPLLLHDALEEGGLADVDGWWNRLDEGSRAGLIELWDDCASRQAFASLDDAVEMELRVVATPTDPDSDTFDGFWNHEFYNYLVNHEAYYFEEQKFHICTAQPAARRALEAGVISSNHVCALKPHQCPMKIAVERANGRSLRLSITFVPRVRPK